MDLNATWEVTWFLNVQKILLLLICEPIFAVSLILLGSLLIFGLRYLDHSEDSLTKNLRDLSL